MYVRGKAASLEAARAAVQSSRDEASRLYAEGKVLAETIQKLRERNANIEAKIADERDRLEDKRAGLTAALADLEAAQEEADAAITEAEDKASLIRELAYDQARAIAERTYDSAYSRGKDHAKAKHATICHVLPGIVRQRPRKGKTNVRIPA